MKRDYHIYQIAVIVLLVIVSAITTARAATVSIEEAFELVSAQVTEPDVNYYICENPDSNNTFWQFFVDAEPNKAWAHDCYLISVSKNAESQEAVVYKDKLRYPPKLTLRPYKVKKRVLKARALNTTYSVVNPYPTPMYGRRIYALIINGGGDVNMNTEYDWNDCAFIYNTLRNTYGVPKNNIEVLMSDGDSPFPDMKDMDDEMMSSDTDLDGDGDDEVTGAATYEEFQDAVSRLASKMTENDLFFLFLKGPAERSDENGTIIQFWNDEYDANDEDQLIDKTKLVNALSPVLYKDCLKNLVLSYNYSGDYPAEFKKDDVFVTTACGKKQQTTRIHGVPYNDFPYLWISAINRVDPYGSNVGSDYDGDGYISMLEAVNNVYERRQFKDNPQYYSKTTQLPKMLNFNYIMSSNDLYIADNETQNKGWECLKPSVEAWCSPDIWVHEISDEVGSNELIYDGDAKIYVRVHNPSWKSSKAGLSVKLNWSFNSMGQQPATLNGHENIIGYSTGGYIGEILLPSIPPFSSQTIMYAWTLPTDMMDFINNESNPFRSISICAEILEKGQSPITNLYPTNLNLYNQVKNDKRVAVNNSLLIEPTKFNGHLCLRSAFIMRNNQSSATKYDLEILSDTIEGSIDKLWYSKLMLKMPLSLYNKWESGGGFSLYLADIYDDYAGLRLDRNGVIKDIPIDANGSVVLELLSYGREMEQKIDFVMKDKSGNIYDGITVVVPSFEVLNPLNTASVIENDRQCFSNKTNIVHNSVVRAELNQAVEPENQTCVYISDLMTADVIASKEVGIGEREVDIDLTSLPKGLYVVNLIENGVMIDNVKISLQ